MKQQRYWQILCWWSSKGEIWPITQQMQQRDSRQHNYDYDNDGPGISDELFDQKQYENTIDRYVKIIPGSAFGLIFERPCKKIIVESDQLPISTLLTVENSRNDFIRAKSN